MTNYSTFSNLALKNLLASRFLTKSGVKEELIQRLENDDLQKLRAASKIPRPPAPPPYLSPVKLSLESPNVKLSNPSTPNHINVSIRELC